MSNTAFPEPTIPDASSEPSVGGSAIGGSAIGGSARSGRAANQPARCAWCGRRLPERQGVGRPRRFCRQGCRQQAHIARKFATERGLGADDVIIERQSLDSLRSAVYCLQAALEDVDADLRADDSPAEVRRALDWLIENARPVAELWVEPRAVDT